MDDNADKDETIRTIRYLIIQINYLSHSCMAPQETLWADALAEQLAKFAIDHIEFLCGNQSQTHQIVLCIQPPWIFRACHVEVGTFELDAYGTWMPGSNVSRRPAIGMPPTINMYFII